MIVLVVMIHGGYKPHQFLNVIMDVLPDNIKKKKITYVNSVMILVLNVKDQEMICV